MHKISCSFNNRWCMKEHQGPAQKTFARIQSYSIVKHTKRGIFNRVYWVNLTRDTFSMREKRSSFHAETLAGRAQTVLFHQTYITRPHSGLISRRSRDVFKLALQCSNAHTSSDYTCHKVTQCSFSIM